MAARVALLGQPQQDLPRAYAPRPSSILPALSPSLLPPPTPTRLCLFQAQARGSCSKPRRTPFLHQGRNPQTAVHTSSRWRHWCFASTSSSSSPSSPSPDGSSTWDNGASSSSGSGQPLPPLVPSPPPAGIAAAVGGAGGMQGDVTPEGTTASGDFCIIEGPDTLQDFARMQLEEIKDNITSRRNRIFLLMEEIRRLRIQQRIKGMEHKVAAQQSEEEEEEMPEYPSFIPFLPPLTAATLKEYYAMFFTLVFAIILFGGLVAPTLELRLGVGGTSYEDFIRNVGLPSQLSQVDPIVASFSGGAVGVLSALLVVEVNNVKQQEHKKCMYCHGTGYLACARCFGSGSVRLSDISNAADVNLEAAPRQPLIAVAAIDDNSSENGAATIRLETSKRCPNCAGSAKVMCPTCLCTGMALATEHDPRIDPFD